MPRRQKVPLLGTAKEHLLRRLFGVAVLEAWLTNGDRVLSPVRCLDSYAEGSKVRSVYTDVGRVRVSVSTRVLL